MNEFETNVLINLLDGQDPLITIDYFGAEAEKIDLVRRKRVVLAAVRSLMMQGLIEARSFEKWDSEESEWRTWSGTVDEQVERLALMYTPEVEDWESWGFLCWFAHTPQGEKVAEALNAEISRD